MIRALSLTLLVLLFVPLPAEAEKPLVGLITGLGSLEDSAFNAMQYNGMVLAKRKFGVPTEVRIPHKMDDDAVLLEELAQKGCALIFCGGGFHMQKPVDVLSRKYPETFFVLLDDFALSYPENVASITFRQNEGSYLVGALAALVSRTGELGFLGAADFTVINDFYAGYAAGARAVRPEITVHKNFIGELTSDFSPFNAPLRAMRLASEMYANGADVIFAVAAGSNRGIFKAAEEEQHFAIGVDSDQDHMAKGFILTSMLKKLDRAVVWMVGQFLAGKVENRNFSLGLAEDAIGLSPMTYTRPLIPSKVLDTVESLRLGIVSGEIQVPGTMKADAPQ